MFFVVVFPYLCKCCELCAIPAAAGLARLALGLKALLPPDTPDEEIDEDLKKAYSAQFVLDRSFDVTVKVSAQVADIFRERNHLPNQNSKILPDGSLLVTSTISTYEDIDPEIKSWIPYIEVIEPLDYKERFKVELQEYINSLI